MVLPAAVLNNVREDSLLKNTVKHIGHTVRSEHKHFILFEDSAPDQFSDHRHNRKVVMTFSIFLPQ
jgi:hypothetical protein